MYLTSEHFVRIRIIVWPIARFDQPQPSWACSRARWVPSSRSLRTQRTGTPPPTREPPWRQPRGKSQVNIPQMLPPGGIVLMRVDSKQHLFTPGLSQETIYLPLGWYTANLGMLESPLGHFVSFVADAAYRHLSPSLSRSLPLSLSLSLSRSLCLPLCPPLFLSTGTSQKAPSHSKFWNPRSKTLRTGTPPLFFEVPLFLLNYSRA